jgi:hypothetical protein
MPKEAMMGMLAGISAHMDRQGRLMAGMMERLDVDLESVGNDPLGVQLGRAVRACAFCRHGDDCEAWQTEASSNAAHAPDFCPNRGYWAMHRRQ